MRLRRSLSESYNHKKINLVFAVQGEIFNKMIRSFPGHHPAAEMLQPVTHQQPFNAVNKIVAGYLVKSVLSDFYRRGFAFHQHDLFARIVKKQDVRTFLQGIEFESAFQPDQGTGILFLIDQELHQVLPNPFLRSQDQEFPANLIKNVGVPRFLFQSEGIIGEIERNGMEHGCKVDQNAEIMQA